MSSYSPDVRQFHKTRQAETLRNTKHAQQQRQQSRQGAAHYFDRSKLPSPASYFEAQGLALKGGGAWRDAVCPFHQDTKPSLRINIENGAYRCMACGARGGDVLAFHMHRHGLGFVAAAKELNAWIGGAK